MGKVAAYCQISGCSPEAEQGVKFQADDEYGQRYGPKVIAALEFLISPDEVKGQQALSIIGPFDANNTALWDDSAFEVSHSERAPGSVDEAIALPEGCVRVLSGCTMGDTFDMGFCEGPDGEETGAIVSYGFHFIVLTLALPILAAATFERVSPRRLWNLVMSRGHIEGGDYGIKGVNYGPIEECWDQFPQLFGDLTNEEMAALEQNNNVGEIADIIKARGFWMWMRPDRFPIGLRHMPEQFLAFEVATSVDQSSLNSIAKLPAELLQVIALYLPLYSICSLALVSKTTFYRLLGDSNTRDALARAYMRSQARWCLPHGETEMKWWNERNGDDALGWEYLKRCWCQSHSMRNRRRIWRAAESIEEQCKLEEAKRPNEPIVR